MSADPHPLTASLRLGTVAPAGGGHLTSALAVSLLVHVTAALIGVDPPVAADLQVRQGDSAAPVTLTLSLVPAPSADRPPIRVAPPPVGEPDAVPSDDRRPAEVPLRPTVDTADVAALLHQIQQAVQRLAPPPAGQPTADDAVSPAEISPSEPVESEAVESEPVESESVESEAVESEAASASQAGHDAPAGAQVDADARPLPSNRPPAYPPTAVQQGRQGRAVLRVTVDDRGAVMEVTVLQSSGHADLDHAAVEAVQQWRFAPAQQNGRPVTQTIAVPIRFLQP